MFYFSSLFKFEIFWSWYGCCKILLHRNCSSFWGIEVVGNREMSLHVRWDVINIQRFYNSIVSPWIINENWTAFSNSSPHCDSEGGVVSFLYIKYSCMKINWLKLENTRMKKRVRVEELQSFSISWKFHFMKF